ncbi:hypothetical protein [Bartonella sp. CB169]|uniref:hypothetical protein n=1 Tax=Bartonella sp. CB169 TaxID=3112257 RepID=UPI003FA57B94
MSEKIYPVPADIKKMLLLMKISINSGIKKASMTQKASEQNMDNALNAFKPYTKVKNTSFN